MKKIILATLAAASLVACAKEEIVASTNGEAIVFDNAFVDNTTKAIDPSITTTNGKLEGFQVYGTTTGNHDGAAPVNIFNGVNVGWDLSEGVGSEGWKYANQYTQYWINGNYYKFAAIVNAEVSEFDGVVSQMPTKLFYVAENDKDLLYAENDYGTYTTGGETTVKFTFNHLLSKVKFVVKNNITTNTNTRLYQYTIDNIVLEKAYAKGTYDIAQQKWTGADEKTYAFGNVSNATDATDDTEAVKIGAVAAADSATSHYEHLLVPGTISANITATISTWLNGHKIHEEPYSKENVELSFEKGHAYNLVIALAEPGEVIEFSVEKVNGWENGADKNL